MAQQLNRFDELNNLSKEKRSKNRSIPYEEYFGEMDITNYQVDERIGLARSFEKVFFFIFALVNSLYQEKIPTVSIKIRTEDIPVIDYTELSSLYDTAERRLLDVVDEYRDTLHDDSGMRTHINELARDVVDSTIDHITDEYYVSEDRAKFCAEDQANSVANYQEHKEAIASGKTMKQWISMRDNRVRHSHNMVDGVVIGINEAFSVGDSLMMFPKDDSMGANDEEIVNCRCSVRYL